MGIAVIVLLSVLCGLLGTFSGSNDTSKAWRRWGIPTLIVGVGVFHSWWCILSFCIVGILSMGYGVPDDFDDGSDLGRFWYKILGADTLKIDFAVRGTIALLVIISMLYVPIVGGSWLLYGVMSAVYFLIHVAFSAIISGEPVWHVDKYEFLSEDLIVYTNLGVYCLTLVSSL
jgi:hypothetical protein